jgi:hypothetical protein
MGTSDPTGRFLRIDDADTSKPVVDELEKPVASKPCIVSACSGTMQFHERRDVADAPHTLEWRWYASWQCSEDSTHVQLVTHAESPRSD